MTDERLNDAKSGRLPRDVFEAHRQAAADLVPLLRSNALETESNGWVAEANLDAIEAAGLLRLGVPEKFGGTPVDQATMMAVLEELARGCGSTGWVMAIFLAEIGIVRAFPVEAQAEVYGGPAPRISGAVSPTGKLTPKGNGYRLDGQWAFHTGCPGANWSMFLAQLDLGDETPTTMFGLAPMSEMEILPDWEVSGMCGTGSNSVRAVDQFIPGHRVVPVTAVAGDVQISSLPVLVGMARAAIEQFVESLPGKAINFSRYLNKQQATITHLLTGEAQIRVDAAKLFMAELVELAQSSADNNKALSTEEQVRLRAHKAHVARLTREAVELINTQSGASSIYRTVPIQRIFRDIEAISLHALNNASVFVSEYGRQVVGADED